MKKKILIVSFDMEIGGVERSLVSLLDQLDYKKYELDLLLYNHSGEFMSLISSDVNLLKENKKYKTIRQGIGQILKDGYLGISLGRLKAKYYSKTSKECDDTYQMQLMWKYCIDSFPNVEKKYDVAISYLWPHDFILNKVKSNKKIGWIHTDYSKIRPNREMDLDDWEKLDYIVGVSQECLNSFLSVYPKVRDRCLVIENMTSPSFIKEMSKENMDKEYTKNSFNLLSVARFSHAKGIDQGIEAMKILQDRGYKDIIWSIIGYGGDEELIKNLIISYNLENNFILLGKKINPYPYMRECDLYVQPSRYEGKAVTVVEAQILNRPVLITNYPTAKSQVRDGVDGAICELSPEGIANGIERLYLNREILKRLEEKCSEIDFSNSKELEKLYELF